MDFALLIPIIGIVMGVSIPLSVIKFKHREKLEQMRLEASGSNDSTRLAQQDAKIELLQDRIEVLERIITDKSYDVAHQIEALRDTVSIESLKRDRELEMRNAD